MIQWLITWIIELLTNLFGRRTSIESANQCNKPQITNIVSLDDHLFNNMSGLKLILEKYPKHYGAGKYTKLYSDRRLSVESANKLFQSITNMTDHITVFDPFELNAHVNFTMEEKKILRLYHLKWKYGIRYGDIDDIVDV